MLMNDLHSSAVVGCGGELSQSARGMQDTNEVRRACRPRVHSACRVRRVRRVVVYYWFAPSNHILTNQEVLWWRA